jgi:hypothetical protein
MPLTAKGQKILENMEQEYGQKKGEEVFYASRNKGNISGVDSASELDANRDDAATAYKVGSKVWSGGDEVTIVSEPYTLHGGEWQDGKSKSGKTVTIPTPAYKQKRIEQSKREHESMQEGFKRLKGNAALLDGLTAACDAYDDAQKNEKELRARIKNLQKQLREAGEDEDTRELHQALHRASEEYRSLVGSGKQDGFTVSRLSKAEIALNNLGKPKKPERPVYAIEGGVTFYSARAYREYQEMKERMAKKGDAPSKLDAAIDAYERKDAYGYTPSPKISKKVEEKLTNIAKKHTGIETLKTRNSDRFDFHDVNAEGMRRALHEAYESGRAAGSSKIKK